MYRLILLGVCAGLAVAQTTPPQELLKRAIDEHQAGSLDQAVRDYRAFLESYPDVAEVRSNLGAALAAQGVYEQAVVEYQKSLKLKANPQVQLNLGLAYSKMGLPRQAVAQLEPLHTAQPSDDRVTELLLDAYLQLGENAKVIETAKPLYAVHPSDLALTYLLGTALVRDHQTEEGQRVIDRILRKGDSAEAHLLMGTTEFMINDFTSALKDLQRAIDLNPALPDVNAYYGMALLATGDQDGGRKAFEKELAGNANNFEANLRLGVLYRQDDNLDGAMKLFEKALAVRPSDFGARFQIASCEFAQGRVEPARQDLESILKEAPNFTEAHVTLATVYYREKRKTDGDREREIANKLSAEKQSKEPGARTAN